jgi:hypothetical protein
MSVMTSETSGSQTTQEPPAQIMVIRHAEKPPDAPPPSGVQQDGTQDPHSLIVQGWQRAGALVSFFSAPTNPQIQRPTYLYAPSPHGSQEAGSRPLETVTPLGAKLGISPNTTFAVGSEQQLVSDVLRRSGLFVLIAWEHKHIPIIGNLILQNQTTVPQSWPGDRFDVVWVFDLQLASGGYAFSQAPQLLLLGDLPGTIPTGSTSSL